MHLFRDVGFSFRTLRKSPGFALATIFSLAIGIGATTTIFTLVNALFLEPLPGIRTSQELVNLHRTEKGDEGFSGFSLPLLQDIRTSGAFSGVAAFTDRSLSVTRNGDSELIAAQIVSGNYFSVLGTRPEQGRFFLPEEDQARGSHPVAVISHAYWQRHLGGAAGVVGQKMILNNVPFTIIGITPRGFGGTFIGFVYDIWIPTAMAHMVLQRTNLEERGNPWLEALARRRPGLTVTEAQAEMSTLSRRLAQSYNEDRDFEIVLYPLTGFDEDLRGGVIAFLIVLMSVTLFVLLIACVNVANMLLVRSLARSKEIAVRLALGMSRSRLVAQLLTESVVLALLGGAAGVLLANWGVAALRQFEPPAGIPLVFDFSIDYRVLTFAFVLSVLSGLAFGLVPARQASRPDLVSELKGVATGNRGARIRSAFVVAQIAVSLLLLITAGLFLRALQFATSVDPGFDATQVQVVSLDPSVIGYDIPRSRDFFLQLVDRVKTVPGVQTATVADSTPLGLGNLFGGSRTPIQVDGVEPPPGKDSFRVSYSRIGSGYLDVLSIPLLRGREFTAVDRDGSHRVAIVNETMAKHFWPGKDPIGRTIVHEGQRVEIVGLARDSKYARVNESPKDFLYLPFVQVPVSRMTLFVRVAEGKPSAISPALRTEVRALAENLPILNVMSMEESIAISRLPQRIAAAVASSLGLTGLLLAAIGIYGVVAYSVNLRLREIGIRMALGAHRGDVLRLIVRQAVLLALVGVVVGCLGAFALSRLLTGLLFGLNPSDPLTFVSIATLLLAIAIVASFFPARRASRTNPLVAFRAS